MAACRRSPILVAFATLIFFVVVTAVYIIGFDELFLFKKASILDDRVAEKCALHCRRYNHPLTFQEAAATGEGASQANNDGETSSDEIPHTDDDSISADIALHNDDNETDSNKPSDDATRVDAAGTQNENNERKDMKGVTSGNMFDFLPPLPNRHFNTMEDGEILYVVRQYEEADVPMDDLSADGKSCVWDYLRNHRWICQECSSGDGVSKCHGPLAVNSVTNNFYERKFEWDEPPRLSSSSNPMSLSTLSDSVLTMYEFGTGPAYQTVQCDSSVLAWPCFDMERCFPKGEDSVGEEGSPSSTRLSIQDQNLTIYLDFPPKPEWVDKPKGIELISDPSSACLVVLTEEMASFANLTRSDSWMGGQNHFLWKSTKKFEGQNHDFPFPVNGIHFEFAALGSYSTPHAQLRRDYDVGVAYHSQWEPPPDARDRMRDEDARRPKLLSFKGKFLDWGQPYHNHRWIAAEYWDLKTGDVMLDVYAEPGKEWYDYPRDLFSDFLLNATFAFCPGGQSPGSYRFLEVLRAGAIPVVISEFAAPLEPDVDWSLCLVRVSEARLIDLPAMLRRISEEEIVRRRIECRALWDTLLGEDVKGGDFGFSVSMVLWDYRIRRAQRRRRGRKTLRESIMQQMRERQRRRFLLRS